MDNIKPVVGSLPDLSHFGSQGVLDDYLINQPKGAGNSLLNTFSNDRKGVISGATKEHGRFGTDIGFSGSASDFVDFPVPHLANLRTGFVDILLKIPANSGTQQCFFSVSATSGSRTELIVMLDFRGSPQVDVLKIEMRIDGALQFRHIGVNNELDDIVGTYVRVTLSQDGVTPSVFINGFPSGGTFNAFADLTVWFKDMFDAVNPATVGTFGLIRHLGLLRLPFAGSESHVRIGSRPISTDTVKQNNIKPFAMYPDALQASLLLTPGVIINQLQGPNVGADLYNGTLM